MKIVFVKRITAEMVTKFCQRAINKTPIAVNIVEEDIDYRFELEFNETLTVEEIAKLNDFLPRHKAIIQ